MAEVIKLFLLPGFYQSISPPEHRSHSLRNVDVLTAPSGGLARTVIDSARRKLEHRLNQLEKKLERQSSEEWDEPSHVEDTKELSTEECERMFGRVTDECHAILESQREILDNVTSEIRTAVEAGFDRLQDKLVQLNDGNDMQCLSIQKPGTKCEMKCGLKVRVARHAAVGCDCIKRSTVQGHCSGAQNNSEMDSASAALRKFLYSL